MVYSFTAQNKIGKKGELLINEAFSPEWLITPSTLTDQKQGIDFYFKHREKEISCTVEIKTDTKAHITGNAFFETYSDHPGKQGWAYTCKADYFFYLVLNDRLIYVFSPNQFPKLVKKWTKYPIRKIPNKGWTTVGHLVPLDEFERKAQKVLSI